MSDKELPPGWVWSTLADIAEVNPATDLSALTDESAISFVPMASVEEESGRLDPTQTRPYSELKRKSLTRFREGDLLFAKITPCMENGKIALAAGLVGGVGYGSTEFHVIRAAEGVSPRYLLHYLLQKSVRVEAERNMTGAVGQRRVPTEYLRNLAVPVPPLAEQERIVDALEGHLSRLEYGISTISTSRCRLSQLGDSVYQQALTGTFSSAVAPGDAVSIDHVHAVNAPLRTKKTKAYDLAKIRGYSLPANWLMVAMGELSYDSGYGTSTKCDYEASGLPVLRIPNVQDGTLNLDDLKFAINGAINLSNYFLSPGDALFVRTNGSRNLIGRVGVVEKALSHAFASYLVRFRFSTELVEPKWIQVVTQSPLWRAKIEQYAASSAGQYNLNIQSLSSLPIPLPPLSTQRSILARVEEYRSISDRMQSEVDQVHARADRLRSSLMREAFEGRLVPQDPVDESASVLLDRIRVERATRPKVKRGRVSKKTSAESTRPAPSVSSEAAGTFVQEELGL